MNSKLYSNEYEIPIEIIGSVQVALAKHSGNPNGLKRAKYITNNRRASYSELKRLKNYFDHPEQITNPEEYALAGGDAMKQWVEQVLTQERDSIKGVEKSRQTNDRPLNIATLKIQTPQTLQPLREGNKDTKDEATTVVLVNPDHKILLLKRGKTAPWEPGKWAFAGGMLMKGEDPATGAKRETKEETGLKITRVIEKFVIEKDGMTEHVFYSVVPENADVKINDESDGFRFVTFKEIEKMAKNDETVPFLREYAALVLFDEIPEAGNDKD